jgi:D-arabinose 1-dehydrogenase-like Zn-dependent alcohol dehydrogenase
MEAIPHAVYLTVYDGGPTEFRELSLTELLKKNEEGTMSVKIGKGFKLDEIVEAYETMEQNKVLTE